MNATQNGLADSLRRDDMAATATSTKTTGTRVMWTIMRGDGNATATTKLYTGPRARRFVRLARRFGLDVYATRFGRVRA